MPHHADLEVTSGKRSWTGQWLGRLVNHREDVAKSFRDIQPHMVVKAHQAIRLLHGGVGRLRVALLEPVDIRACQQHHDGLVRALLAEQRLTDSALR